MDSYRADLSRDENVVLRLCGMTRKLAARASPFETAVKQGEVEDLRVLVERGGECALALPDEVAPFAWCLLMGIGSHGVGMSYLMDVALSHKKLDIARYLVSLGAWVDDGLVTLARACTCSETRMFVLDAGADVNARDEESGCTPLMFAVGDDAAWVRCLLDRGADVHARDKQGRTALSIARETNASQEVVRMLLDRGADCVDKDAAAFDTVVRWCRAAAKKQLRTGGGDPFLEAVENGGLEDMRTLVEHGGACARARPLEVYPFVHRLQKLFRPNCALLRAQIADQAVGSGNLDLVRYLFSVFGPRAFGPLSVQVAIWEKDEEMLAFLLDVVGAG